jgi:hypothetical protein
MVSHRSSLIEGIINSLTLALIILMSWAVWHGLNMSDGVRLSGQVISQLPVSGVSNPVTAVLLNFRAYDTLLELAVVLTAVLTVLTLNEKRADYDVFKSLTAGHDPLAGSPAGCHLRLSVMGWRACARWRLPGGRHAGRSDDPVAISLPI